jgi:hypothetical protein
MLTAVKELLAPSPASLNQPAGQPPVSISTYTYTDLIDFLQQYERNCPTVKMICLWDGEPLLSITVDLGPELSLKVKFFI